MNTGRALLASAAELCFVVPSLTGPLSGGTLYNCELLAGLHAEQGIRQLELGAPTLGEALSAARAVFVDSLYLFAVPELRRQVRGRLWLIVHYLPSFVALGRACASAELSLAERAALACADAFLVTSAFMRDALEALVAPPKMIIIVEPGTRAKFAAAAARAQAELSVVMIGNVVPGKGIERWLRALAASLTVADRLRLSIIGSLGVEPAYAEQCQRLVRESPSLAQRVAFLGALLPADTLSWLARAELLVSASRMESYGMALNEARVVGVPILARIGGNAAAHVDPEAGGELAADDDELARACVALARDATQRSARAQKARARALAPRSWQSAAREFSAQLALWEK